MTQPALAPPDTLRVLVVDADADARRACLAWLHDDGHLAIGASSLASARRIWRAHPIDVVVTEMHLPDGGGDRLTELLRREHPRVGVVGLTARADHATHARFEAAGGDVLMAKPWMSLDMLGLAVRGAGGVLAARSA